MTISTAIEKHKDYFLFPVFVVAFNRKTRELDIELGIIIYTLNIKIK
jgi:hypothetical protein